MPFYSKSAFPHDILRMGNNPWPNYLFGKFDTKTQPMIFKITNVALTSNVATVTVSLVSGGGPGFVLPVVGETIGIQGTTSTGGVFNVDPATITATTVDTTGAGTISYSVTHANIGTAADVGILVALPFETPDAATVNATSIPVSITSTPDESDNSRCVFAECTFPSLPTTATVVLQGSNVDVDSRYITLSNSAGNTNLATVAGGAITQGGAQYEFVIAKFLRMKITVLTGGTSPTIVGTLSA